MNLDHRSSGDLDDRNAQAETPADLEESPTAEGKMKLVRKSITVRSQLRAGDAGPIFIGGGGGNGP